MGLSVVVTSVLLMGAAAAGGQHGACVGQPRFWGGDGPATHVVVVNDHAFFGGRTLRVASLADPASPEVVHELRLEGPVSDLDVLGDRVYLVDQSSELTVIDAAVPPQATVAARFIPLDPTWNLHLMDIHGNLAVVGARPPWSTPWTFSNLSFLDLSGTSPEPLVTGSLEISGAVSALALGDGVAVAATRSNRLFFIDVADPGAPIVAVEVDASQLISGQVADLAARDTLLAVSDTHGTVVLIDISVPESPAYLALVQNLDIGVATLEFEGPLLHVAGSTCTELGVCGGYAVVDVIAPTRPRLIGRLDGPELERPVPYQGHVMAAALRAGLRVVDLRGLTNPVLLDAVLPMRQAGAIASAGRLVHVVDTTNLSDPEAPERNSLEILFRGPDDRLSEAGSYHPEGAIWALAAAGDTVAAAMYNEANGFHSVEVIDVADPATPVVGSRLGARLSIEYDTNAPHLAMVGRRLYLSLEGSDHILIYEVIGGGRVRQRGDYRPGAELVNFAAPSEDLLAVALRDGDTGWIELIDVRAPSSPVLASTFALPEPADVPVTVSAEGNRVAVLCRDFDGSSGPYTTSIVLDVTDPTSPTLAFDNLPGGRWIDMGAGILHTIADTYPPSGFRHAAVNVIHPPEGIEAASLGRLDIGRDRVDVDGPYLCLSRGQLEVYRFSDCGPIAASFPAQTVIE